MKKQYTRNDYLNTYLRFITLITLFNVIYINYSQSQNTSLYDSDSGNHYELFKNIVDENTNKQTKELNKSGNKLLLDSVYKYTNLGDFAEYNQIYYAYDYLGKLGKSVNLKMNAYGEFLNITETKTYNSQELYTEYKIEMPYNLVNAWSEDTSLFTTYLEKCSYSNQLLINRDMKNINDYQENQVLEQYSYTDANQLELFTTQANDYFDTIQYYYLNSGLIDYELHLVWSSNYYIYKYKYETLNDTTRIYKKRSPNYSGLRPIVDTIKLWNEEVLFEKIFDENGRLSSLSKTYISGKQPWHNEYISEFEYNDNNQLLKAKYSLLMGTKKELLRISNEYDVNNNLINSTSYFYDDKFNDWVISEQQTYYYSNHAVDINEAQTVCFKVYPNPANNIVNLSIDQTNSLPIQVFSLDGKLIETIESIPFTFTLNISNYKPGIYMICTYNKSILHTTKLIKY